MFKIKYLCNILIAILLTATTVASAQNPQIEMRTSLGTILLELYPENAPETVKNFVQYANDGFYNGTIFHRVISDFMIQGGGFTPDLAAKKTRDPIKHEGGNGLRNEIGTIAMARTRDPDSATSQFFINVVDNVMLDFRERTPDGIGYTVFGRVIKGMDVVNKIRQVPTVARAPHQNVPVTPVIIERVTMVGPGAKPATKGKQ